jgi:hypothetical protein
MTPTCLPRGSRAAHSAPFDTDFGQLAFHKGKPSNCGIVFFRIPIASADDAARRIVATILSRSDWQITSLLWSKVAFG